MSETVADTVVPAAEILPAKSEDKLEIEKEELEAAATEQEAAKEEESAMTEADNKTEEAASEGTTEEAKPAEDSPAEEAEKKADETEKKADKKKFSLPKVKAPKVLTELRSKSKERKKNKEKKEEHENKEEQETKAENENKDQEEKKEEDNKGGEVKEGENNEETTEKADAEKDKVDEESEVKGEANEEAKKDASDDKDTMAKVKDVLDNIKLPKIHRPAFLKKKTKSDTDKKEEEGEENTEVDAKGDENKEEATEDRDDKTEKTDKEAADEPTVEADKDAAAPENDLQEVKKASTLLDSLKGIKAPKVPKIFKGKKRDGEEEEKKEEGEAEKLLENREEEEKEEQHQAEEKGEIEKEGDQVENEEKEKVKSNMASLLHTIRSTASGLPALFKKRNDILKEVDVEMGETENLLEKKPDAEEVDSNKKEKLEMEEIPLEEKKEPDTDTKSQGSEKKDPEKGEIDGEPEKSILVLVKGLDDRQKCGLLGILGGTLLLLIIIIAAVAASSASWKNHHRYVEGGKYIETHTGCGSVWGHVDGHASFSFRGIPYSVQVDRFVASRLASTLDECGDEIKQPVNESVRCIRRTAEGIKGEEDCLTLDIFTSSVLYDTRAPVVVYVPGDEEELVPSSQLAGEQGVVFVVVNVRQGVLGFLSHALISASSYPLTSGNYALGDLLTALKWIRLNIAHFGGNPDSVTLLGHGQGAGLVTAITGVEAADGLYHRVWSSNGPGRLSNASLDEANERWEEVVEAICGDVRSRECLLEADVNELLDAVDQHWELWGHGNLPKSGEESMEGLLVVDTHLLTQPLLQAWHQKGIKTPIVFGVGAQTEASMAGYEYLAWNNSDTYQEMVEGRLGSWNSQLPAQAFSRYNSSNNWVDYMSMVSDIRTICPLQDLAKAASAPLYIATQPRPGLPYGPVADSSADLAAVFGTFPQQNNADSLFVDNMQNLFYNFVKSQVNFGGIQLVGSELTYKASLENCAFWRDTEARIVPNHGKVF